MAKHSGSAQRVREALVAHDLDNGIVRLDASARTAAEAAAALGCSVAQIVKSLLFKSASGEPLLVLASGTNRVDEALIATVAGESIGKADAAFVREHTGYAIGGVAPLAHPKPLRAYIDSDLMQLDPLWAAAGTPHTVFRLSAVQLQQLSGGQVTRVC